MFINVFAIDARDDVLIDSLTTVTVGASVNMLVDVEVTVLVAVNVVSGVMTELECTRSASLEACLLSCCTAFAC